jgi:8-oxo-dGTP diphosphatase
MSSYVRQLRAVVGARRLLLPSVTGVVRDAAGGLLLVQHRDDGRWATPGGMIEPGETPADAVVREVWEESGLLVVPERVLAVYGGAAFVVRYPNGDESQYVSTVFACAVCSGAPRGDGAETLAARFFAEADARALPLPSWLVDLLPLFFEPPRAEAWFEPPHWTPPVG